MGAGVGLGRSSRPKGSAKLKVLKTTLTGVEEGASEDSDDGPSRPQAGEPPTRLPDNPWAGREEEWDGLDETQQAMEISHGGGPPGYSLNASNGVVYTAPEPASGQDSRGGGAGGGQACRDGEHGPVC